MPDPSQSPSSIPYGFEDVYRDVVKAEDPDDMNLDELMHTLGDENIFEFDERPLYLPPTLSTTIPSLDRQDSLATSAAKNLIINDIKNIEQINIAIETINKYLKKISLYWNITYLDILSKLQKNSNYLANTLYYMWNLKVGANLAMHDSLIKNPDGENTHNLFIDYANLKIGLLRNCIPKKNSDNVLAQEIGVWINITMRTCTRIIISVQKNVLFDRDFTAFKEELKFLLGDRGDVIVILAPNASTFDDFNIAYIIVNLLPKSTNYIISNDQFSDIVKLDTNYIGWSKIFNPSDKLLLVGINTFCKAPYHRYIEKSSRPSIPPGSHGPYIHPRHSYKSTPYGGTNKNKYTKKVKTLHKKRNTSKKVLKKYNKNYKKKTFRRKNK